MKLKCRFKLKGGDNYQQLKTLTELWKILKMYIVDHYELEINISKDGAHNDTITVNKAV